MPIDYSHSALPKGPTRAAMKAARDALREALDLAESKKVKARSGGVRGRGTSALAINKVHVCVDCHRKIHAHVLVHQGGFRFQHGT